VTSPCCSPEGSFPEGALPEGKSQVQVLVLGAGPAALAAAEGLVRKGLQVNLLPPVPWKQAPVLNRAGVALPLPGPSHPFLVGRLGRSAARRLWAVAARGAADLRTRLAGVDCDLERGGVMVLAGGQAESDEMVASLADLLEDGVEARMMGPSAATGYLPAETEYPAMYLGGAAAFHPSRALAALATQVAREGVTFLQSVSELHWTETRLGVEVAGQGFHLHADLLILAEGFETEVPGLIRGEAGLLWTAPLRQGLSRITMAALADGGREVYRSGPEGGLVANISPESEDPVSCLHRRFPEARKVAIRQFWSAPWAQGQDGLPLVGILPGSRRVHLLAGFGNQPWSLAWGAGQDLALSPEGPALAPPGRFR
jgi:glycine/D-amino acid oxidase-like deaminating enzyme